jgi:hypothetical protein
MKVGGLEEAITVKAESPMVETQKASTSFTIDGELLKSTPITARGIFTDAIDMVPGVGSRQADDGSGIRIYYFMGSGQLSSFMALEGVQFGGYANPAPARTSMSIDTVGDTEVRTGGADASTPLTTGIFLNVVAPQGGNQVRGSAVYTFQPLRWNSDNTGDSGGLPKPEGVSQLDLSLGGSIVTDKVWYFGSFRHADDTNGISRTAQNLANLRAFRPDFEPFNNKWRTKNPFVKVTAQLTPGHTLSSYYIYDRSYYTSHREFDTDPVTFQSGGGSLVSARLNSLWGQYMTSQLTVAYNNKGNASEDTYEDLNGSGPQVLVHNDIFLSSGLATGTGMLVRMDNTQIKNIVPSSALYLQGEVAYFRSGWLGSHEFKAGFFGAPRNRLDTTNQYVNDGFVLEEVRQIDPSNPAAGVTPFHLRFITPSSIKTVSARDKDIGIYVQDSWKPTARLTASVGLRVDWVRRFDEIMGIQRMASTEVGPRVGLSYQLTRDSKTVLRFFGGRIHDMVAGSDPVTSFASTTPVTTRDVYIDKAGVQTTVITPPPTAALAALQIDGGLHQPYVDEFIVGVRRQLPYQISLDVSGRRREFKDMYGLVDINGIYPSDPFQPFGGFGLVDATRGILFQQRNNTWSSEVVNALEVVVAKNLSHDFQAMLSVSRQWQHLDGTWNPTDPARFIQPDAFPNDRVLPASSGNSDTNTLDGGSSTFSAWRPYSVRFVAQYQAPLGISLAGSYQVSAGDYSAPIFTRLAAADPVFGPARVTLPNGTTQPNPLATTLRFNFPTRGDGQVLNEPTRTLQLKIGWESRLGPHRFSTSLNVFNALNSGASALWATGANQLYNPAYLTKQSRLPARGFQVMFGYRY